MHRAGAQRTGNPLCLAQIVAPHAEVGLARVFEHALADPGGTGEADAVDIGAQGQRFAGLVAIAGTFSG